MHIPSDPSPTSCNPNQSTWHKTDALVRHPTDHSKASELWLAITTDPYSKTILSFDLALAAPTAQERGTK